MALQIWLPLTEDTRNQGLYDCGVTNLGATHVTNDGILGGCYKFNQENPSSYTKYMELDACLEDFVPDGGSFSMAVWFKMPSSYGPLHVENALGFGFISTSDYQKSGVTIGLTVNGYPTFQAFTSGGGIDTTIIGDAVSFDKWYHYCVTYDKDTNKVIAYLNGETRSWWSLTIDSWANYAGRKVRIGRSTQGGWEDTFPGWLSDVRIYDHCLSPKEVKEISKGLAAHYKFDDVYVEGTTNIASTSSNYDGVNYGVEYPASSWGGDAGTCTYYANGGYDNGPYKVYHKTASGTGGTYRRIANDIVLESGKTYTMSVYVKSDRDYVDSHYSFNINRGSDNYYITFGQNVHFTTGWTRLVKTFTTTSAQSGNYGEMSIIYNDSVLDYYVYYSCFQIEEKDHATPFAHGTRDGGAISDSSGYEKHGHHESGAVISVATDGGRYGVALENTDGYIGRAEVNMPPLNSITFSWWGNYTEHGYQTSGMFSTSDDGSSPTDYNTTAVHMRDGGFDLCNTGGTHAYFKIDNTYSFKKNSWDHYALTYDGASVKFYVDGTLIKSTAFTGTLKAFKYVYFGYSKAGGTTRMCKCVMSDFRIYSTALSANDILELYHTSASIEKNGNFDCYEISESDTDQVIIDLSNTNGIVKTGWGIPYGPYYDPLDGSLILSARNGWEAFGWDTTSLAGVDVCVDFDYLIIDRTNTDANSNITVGPMSAVAYFYNSEALLDITEENIWKHFSTTFTADKFLSLVLRGVDNGGDYIRVKIKNMTVTERPAPAAASIGKNGVAKASTFKENPYSIPSLYLPAGSYVRTITTYTSGDRCVAKTVMRYEKSGDGRDLMGYSASGVGYWGVNDNGSWEWHAGTFSYTSTDITKMNTIKWDITSGSETGEYQIGRLYNSYSTRSKYIYSVKLYKNGELVRDLYPARIADGTCGMINQMNGDFFPATGNAEIKYDEEINSKANVFKEHIGAKQIIEI